MCIQKSTVVVMVQWALASIRETDTVKRAELGHLLYDNCNWGITALNQPSEHHHAHFPRKSSTLCTSYAFCCKHTMQKMEEFLYVVCEGHSGFIL